MFVSRAGEIMNRDPVAAQPQFDPDYLLVQGMAQGNVHALDELYARRGPGILSFLTAHVGDRQLAEEVLQDVMLAAWNNAASFRGDSSVRTWLLVIARNRAMNTHRKRKLPLVTFDEAFGALSGDTAPLEKVERKTRESKVRDALNQLPLPQREVLVLVFYHQLSGPEVAQVLGINEGTVKSRLHRAKEMLRRVLQSEGL
jgi:RNA polymerase sigma-70 factor (ECF subfamily)